MAPLTPFPLPLPSRTPPGHGWEQRNMDMSVVSTTTAFNAAIDERDTFLGQRRCIICGSGYSLALQHCHIIRDSERENWSGLRTRRWIPSQARPLPRYEPRNGLLMCVDHHIAFDAYDFFIRFHPDTQKFVFVNYSEEPSFWEFHGKAIDLDIKDRHAPYPSLFILHEMRVRAFHPFQRIEPAMPDAILWQDWISSDSVFDKASGSFKRDSPPGNGDSDNDSSSQLQFQPTTTSTVDIPPGRRSLALNADVVADILAATRAMPSWKACEMEGTSWTGTAEENRQKYISSIGVADD